MGKNNSSDHVNKVMDNSISEQVKIPSPDETMKKLALSFQMPFIDADAFIADPYALLGQVIQIRKKGGQCPASIVEPDFPVELAPYPVPHVVNENSKLKKPELRNSIIVDYKLSASVNFLNYLSAELNGDSSFSLMVFDQAAGLIDMNDTGWRPGLEQWKKDNAELINDPEICYLFAIVGFIQKNIVRKKYIKYTGKIKGGAFDVKKIVFC